MSEKPEIWGENGVFARFTKAANGIHQVAEKLRAMKQTCPHCGQPMPLGSKVDGGAGE